MYSNSSYVVWNCQCVFERDKGNVVGQTQQTKEDHVADSATSTPTPDTDKVRRRRHLLSLSVSSDTHLSCRQLNHVNLCIPCTVGLLYRCLPSSPTDDVSGESRNAYCTIVSLLHQQTTWPYWKFRGLKLQSVTSLSASLDH